MPLMFCIPCVCLAELSDDSLETRWQATISDLEQITDIREYPFDDCFESSSAAHGIPKPLIIAMARGESNFDPSAVSKSNAYGIMQIRWPVTANHLGIRSLSDLYDACTNIDAGTRYISELLQAYDGNIHRALAAYNYGPARIPTRDDSIPDGARWYSNYIHGQLVRVLGTDNDNHQIERSLILTSNMRFRAAGQMAYLKTAIPSARFELTRSATGSYQVLLLHSNAVEYRHGVGELDRIGFGPKTTL